MRIFPSCHKVALLLKSSHSMPPEGSCSGPLCLLHFGSFQFLCLSFAISMNRSRLTTLKQRGVARWNTRVLVPIPPYSSRGRGSGGGESSAGEQKRDHGHGEGRSSCGERQKYTGRLDGPAKVASSCKVGEALQSLAWTVELLSFCMDTNGSEPSTNGDHAEHCLIHKVRTPRTVFFCLDFTRFNS